MALRLWSAGTRRSRMKLQLVGHRTSSSCSSTAITQKRVASSTGTAGNSLSLSAATSSFTMRAPIARAGVAYRARQPSSRACARAATLLGRSSRRQTGLSPYAGLAERPPYGWWRARARGLLTPRNRPRTPKHLTLRQALWYVRDDMMSSIVKGQSARAGSRETASGGRDSASGSLIGGGLNARSGQHTTLEGGRMARARIGVTPAARQQGCG